MLELPVKSYSHPAAPLAMNFMSHAGLRPLVATNVIALVQ
jgi:hypothetical protein